MHSERYTRMFIVLLFITKSENSSVSSIDEQVKLCFWNIKYYKTVKIDICTYIKTIKEERGE